MKVEASVSAAAHARPDGPLVSVVMAVFNAAEFLDEAVGSIRNQTYTHWELVCWDDASVDGSWDILVSFAERDKRIHVFRDGKHRGVAGAANLALSKARGVMIARMDADDVACPDRLQRQVAYLLKHQETVAVGGQCALIDCTGNIIGEKLFPTDPEKVRRMIFSSIPVQQPALMVSCRHLSDSFVWYQEGATVAIEVELLFRLFQRGQVANLEDFVLMYRIHNRNISLTHPKRTFFATLKGRIKGVFTYGYRPSAGGVLATLAQTVIVAVLPSRWIYPVYAFVQRLRGFSRQRTSSGMMPHVAPTAMRAVRNQERRDTVQLLTR
jgi:glycosyltransferase involved in cell wall biosynthesis